MTFYYIVYLLYTIIAFLFIYAILPETFFYSKKKIESYKYNMELYLYSYFYRTSIEHWCDCMILRYTGKMPEYLIEKYERYKENTEVNECEYKRKVFSIFNIFEHSH